MGLSQKALQSLAADYSNREILDYIEGVSYNLTVSRAVHIKESESESDSDAETENEAQ